MEQITHIFNMSLDGSVIANYAKIIVVLKDFLKMEIEVGKNVQKEMRKEIGKNAEADSYLF